MVLRRLLMVLRVLVRLLLVVREGVDAHVAVVTTPLGISHGSGGEVGGRHHDWGLHALLPHLAAAAALLWKGQRKGRSCQTRCTTQDYMLLLPPPGLYLCGGPTF